MTRREQLLKKKHLDILYDEFWEIYNLLPNNNFEISDTFVLRINHLHYTGKSTLSRLLIGIKWMIDNLDLDKYCVKYSYKDKYPYMDVFYLNEGKKDRKRLCEFKIVKDKVIIIDEVTIVNVI